MGTNAWLQQLTRVALVKRPESAFNFVQGGFRIINRDMRYLYLRRGFRNRE
jgi:hypothetical protein